MMIDKIMKELWKRLEASVEEFIEIRMKKSGDVVIITPDGSADDPETIYELKSFKLQPVYARGLRRLAEEIVRYDRTVQEQQKLIADLYAFHREKIDTGLASGWEIQQYSDTYNCLFGYRPDTAAYV